MADDGYTLAEALAAVTVVGLALGGMSLAVTTIAGQQRRIETAHRGLAAQGAADLALQRLLDGQGPFGLASDPSFSGSASALTFACGAATCRASIEDGRRGSVLIVSRAGDAVERRPLAMASARFASVDEAGETLARWPAGGGRLRAVMIRRGGAGRAVAHARLDVDEGRDCQFDAVIGECRETAP